MESQTLSPITVLAGASSFKAKRLCAITTAPTASAPPTVTYAAAGGNFHCVSRDAADNSGDAIRADLRHGGATHELTASGAISALAPIYADANGKITATVQGPCIGYALEAATADNDEITCILQTNVVIVNSEYNASSVTKATFVAPGPMRVLAHMLRVTAAGTDGGAVTVAMFKAPSGTALGSGTSTMASTGNLKGTANTNQALAISATPAANLLATGDAFGPVFTGTMTAATGVVTTLMVAA